MRVYVLLLLLSLNTDTTTKQEDTTPNVKTSQKERKENWEENRTSQIAITRKFLP